MPAQCPVACPDGSSFSSAFSAAVIAPAMREPRQELLLPRQRMADNCRKSVVTRLPPERIAYPRARGHNASGIPFPPRRILHFKIGSGDAFDRVDDLAH